MSVPPFTVPAGDPDAVRRAAARFGAISVDHQDQLTAFNRQANHALTGWSGPVADQYAEVATEVARRFTAVVTALTSAQRALTAYARALETAQQTVTSLNRQVLAITGEQALAHAMRACTGQESAAVSRLNTAARTCAQALQAATTALAAHCQDTLAAQFTQSVKHAERRLSDLPKGAL